MSRALLVAVVAVAACSGRRYHSAVNAPGKVTLAPPPRENGSPDLFVPPEDPGEREVYIGVGVIGGPGVGRRELDGDDAAAELGAYVRLAYKSTTASHRKDDLPWPARGWALNLGWAPLQHAERFEIGPIWTELERQWFLGSVGLGPAIYPDDGNAGVQATLAWKPYGVRFRYMAETGFEVFAAFQAELPSAITWSK